MMGARIIPHNGLKHIHGTGALKYFDKGSWAFQRLEIAASQLPDPIM